MTLEDHASADLTFARFAARLAELEATSSRTSLQRILSETFTQAVPKEIGQLVYLLQGRVAPVFAPIEFGMADRTVMQSIAGAFDVPREEVQALYRECGDLGDVAGALAGRRPGEQSHDQSISAVFAELRAIADATGSGAVERKIGTLRDLLRRLDPLAARYAVRIVLGRLRLGVGDPTIIQALAAARGGNKQTAAILEQAYNRTSDLGLVARTFWDGGVETVEKLPVMVGNPLRPELAERLPSPDAVIDKLGTVDAQYKYDGIRVQIHKQGDEITLFSRRLEDMTAMFPEICQGARVQVHAQSIILDAEAVGYNPLSEEFLPFQETTRRRRKYGIEEMAAELPLNAFVFDILYKDGQSVLDRPLHERLRILADSVAGGGSLVVSESWIISDAGTLTSLLQEAIDKGLEGLVVKRHDGPYEAGARNFNWVKLKRQAAGALRDTIDCVILGYFAGRGKRAGFGVGALLVGVYDEPRDTFVTVSRIGTGLSDEGWREAFRRMEGLRLDHRPARVDSLIEPSVWVEPRIVVEILADEITRSPTHTAGRRDGEPGYALRFPRLVGFRGTDKRPEDATTVQELREMYRQQSRVP
ncbi:MAG TPA: ATP-dependent DNA ligase [Chloroflexota bacterium]|nr:ATP-dependent DNA ligase [Chloroflexota bacterium]